MDESTVVLLTPAPSIPQKLPPELWEKVIDALADERDNWTGLLLKNTDRTLRKCALVCHSWRLRAQLHLRTTVYIKDVNSLTSLAQRMSTASRPLAPYMSGLTLVVTNNGYYTPSNTLTLLPTLLRSGISFIGSLKLQAFGPYTRDLKPQEVLQHEESILRFFDHNWEPQQREWEPILLPYVPLHPRFPSLVTPVFSTVGALRIEGISFKNFPDFGNLLNCFPCLGWLFCSYVQWITLGVVPGCMTRTTKGTFLQNLYHLQVRTHSIVSTSHSQAYMPHIPDL